MAAAELVLVRHGESVGNVAAAAAYASGAETIEVGCRDADVELSELGTRQATALGGGLQLLLADGTPTRVWSSPYVRARQTIGLALEAAGASLTVAIDERLRDRDLGVLDLLTAAGVLARHPEEAERRRWLGKFYHRPPGGECWADLALRVRSFLRDLESVSDGTRVVLVCHDALVLTMRYVCECLGEAEILGISKATPVLNASITQLARNPGTGEWRLVRFNDVAHLEPSAPTVAS